MRRILYILALLLAPAVAGAQNVTVRDVVELSKAGLGDAALLALIEVNQPIFPVDVETLKGLKDAGVPPAVIVAMIKSGRTPPPPPPTHVEPSDLPADEPAAQPQVVVVEHHHEARVREVAVAVPVYVPVRTRSRAIRGADHQIAPGTRRAPKPAEPVYWGWGGKLRPDAWKPTAADVQKDARVPLKPQRK